MVSVIILTKNEEKDLSRSLASVKWSNDVHILDSGSTDRTIEIAIEHKANVHINPFESFGKQRNFALDNIKILNDWILFLDADEVITDEFRIAMEDAIKKSDDEIAGFYCCWKMMLDGQWLKYCDNFPKWQFRLMRKGRARFRDFGHGQKEDEVKGHIKYLNEPYLHFGFSKGWHQWIERHNKYSSQEAIARINARPPFKDVFSKHSSIRNVALKSWLILLPGWPIIRFMHAYILKLGFWEGKPGFIYCINMAYYEFLIQIKIREYKMVDKEF